MTGLNSPVLLTTQSVVVSLEHFSCRYRVDHQLGSRLSCAEESGSAGLLAGCRVDLPVHVALCTNRKYSLEKFLLGDASATQLHGMSHSLGYLIGRLLIADGDANCLLRDIFLYRCLLALSS